MPRHMIRMFFLGVLLALLLPLPATAGNVYDMVNDAVRAQSDGDMLRAYQLYGQIIDSGKLRDDPKILAHLYNNRAVIFLQQGNEAMALSDVRQAVELYPDHTSYYNLALLLSERGHVKEALENLDKAIELHPDYSNAYELRGHLLIETGKAGQGRKDLAMARKLKLKITFLGPGEFSADHRTPRHEQTQPARERRRVE